MNSHDRQLWRTAMLNSYAKQLWTACGLAPMVGYHKTSPPTIDSQPSARLPLSARLPGGGAQSAAGGAAGQAGCPDPLGRGCPPGGCQGELWLITGIYRTKGVRICMTLVGGDIDEKRTWVIAMFNSMSKDDCKGQLTLTWLTDDDMAHGDSYQ